MTTKKPRAQFRVIGEHPIDGCDYGQLVDLDPARASTFLRNGVIERVKGES